MKHPTLTNSCSPERASGFILSKEKILSPIKQAPLSFFFFQSVTTARKTNWSVTQSIYSVHMGILTLNGYSRSEPPQNILGLHSGNVGQDVPVGEKSSDVQTFLDQFVEANGNYPATDFRTPGWVHYIKK